MAGTVLARTVLSAHAHYFLALFIVFSGPFKKYNDHLLFVYV